MTPKHNEFKFLMGRDRATEQDTATLVQEAPAADEVHEVQSDAPESFEQEATATEPEAEVTLEEQDEFSDTDQLTTEELSMGLIEDAQTASPAAAPQDEHQADEAEATMTSLKMRRKRNCPLLKHCLMSRLLRHRRHRRLSSAPCPKKPLCTKMKDDFGDRFARNLSGGSAGKSSRLPVQNWKS